MRRHFENAPAGWLCGLVSAESPELLVARELSVYATSHLLGGRTELDFEIKAMCLLRREAGQPRPNGADATFAAPEPSTIRHAIIGVYLKRASRMWRYWCARRWRTGWINRLGQESPEDAEHIPRRFNRRGTTLPETFCVFTPLLLCGRTLGPFALPSCVGWWRGLLTPRRLLSS